MTELERHEHGATVCPKRLWVMTTLSDDEAVSGDEPLPQGLRIHLSQCASCRALADQLVSVSKGLRYLSATEPDVQLCDQANAQALTALRQGTGLTGRVSVPEEPEPVPMAPARRDWGRFTRYAAAAAVFIAVGLFGVVELRGPHGVGLLESADPPLTRIASDLLEPAVRQGDTGHAGPTERIAEAGRPNGIGAAEGRDPGVMRAGGRRTVSRRTCRHQSYVEAAQCNDPRCIHRAVILRRRRAATPSATQGLQRVWAAVRGFDSSGQSESTTSGHNGG
jgi:hypothetical protein